VRIRAWGKVGDPIERPGLEKKYPGPGVVGLAGYDRWHLAGPDATGAEEGIAYAPKNFNIGKTATVENVIRRARTATTEQGGEVFFDFEAECRVVGDHDGVSIRIVESAHWRAEVRAAGTDHLVPILDETAAVPAASAVATRPSGGALDPHARAAPPEPTSPDATRTNEPPTPGQQGTRPPAAEALTPEPPGNDPGTGVEPPVEGVGTEPAGEAGGAVAGLGMMIYQAEAGIVARAEAEKARAAIDEEAQNVKAIRKRGEWAGIWVLVNEPRVVDVGIFPTPDQVKTFEGVLVSEGTSKAAASRPPAFMVADPGPARIVRSHLLSTLAPLTTPQAPAAARSPQAAGPKSATQLDGEIDVAIAANNWTRAAVVLNGFSDDDINRRVTSDPRLSGHRRQLMRGSLEGMVRWPPPNRVADAIYRADGTSARDGRIDYIRSSMAAFPLEAAIALNGLSVEDIRRELPSDVDQLKAMRAAAVRAGTLDQLVRLIDEKHAFVTDEEYRQYEGGSK
jgi:hypothetical protein